MDNPVNVGPSVFAARLYSKSHGTLMKAIDAAGLESVDWVAGLEPLGMQVTQSSGLLWPLPHNQYNNWRTIHWYAVNINMERYGIWLYPL